MRIAEVVSLLCGPAEEPFSEAPDLSSWRAQIADEPVLKGCLESWEGYIQIHGLAVVMAASEDGSLQEAEGLDVFEGEPRIHHELLAVPNIVVTPHIGCASLRTRRGMAGLAVDNLVAALGFGPNAWEPRTPVNPEVLG